MPRENPVAKLPRAKRTDIVDGMQMQNDEMRAIYDRLPGKVPEGVAA